jgi:hypothetical protein
MKILEKETILEKHRVRKVLMYIGDTLKRTQSRIREERKHYCNGMVKIHSKHII